jgi:hypothetical protein
MAGGPKCSGGRRFHGPTGCYGRRVGQPRHHPSPVIAALKDAGYLHIPEGRRDHTAPANALYLHGFTECRNEQSGIAPEHCPCVPADDRLQVVHL